MAAAEHDPSGSGRMRLSERRLRALLIGAAIALSAGGVAYAVCCSGRAVDGGRGGALAVAVTLVGYFLRTDLGPALRRFFTQRAPAIRDAIATLRKAKGSESAAGAPAAAASVKAAAPPEGAALEARLDALETQVRIATNSDRAMNRAFAIASAVGTLGWGFGDVAAGMLGAR
jgi:hypothetical protein